MHSDELFVKSIPVYYIGFNKNTKLENNLSGIGFKDVNHFKAIDGRKFVVDDLIENNTITIRSYNDLIFGRHEHAGIPSLGAIGCTLSHLSLWKLCVDFNMPYIIICEDDVFFGTCTLSPDIQYIISNAPKDWEIIQLITIPYKEDINNNTYIKRQYTKNKY